MTATFHETFRQEHVKCGRKGCKKCPHGPYWYAYHREGGKLKKRYVGKDLPKKNEAPPPPPPPHPWDEIKRVDCRDILLACEILGVNQHDDRETVRKKYYYLSMKQHPDRGGCEVDFKRSSAAWEVIRRIKGWR